MVGVDVKNGWMQGGGGPRELGRRRTGMMDVTSARSLCMVAVEGAGWQSRAAAAKRGVVVRSDCTTDVECVTPAHQSGRVPVGVSLAHSTSASYGDGVGYLYL